MVRVSGMSTVIVNVWFRVRVSNLLGSGWVYCNNYG